MRREIDERGFVVAPAVCSSTACRELIAGMPTVDGDRMRGGVRLRIGETPAIDRHATRSALSEIASAILGRPAFPVRAICFDKTATANYAADALPGGLEWLERCA